MDPDSRWRLIVVGLLIVLAAIFAVIETALAAVSRTRIRMLSERGDTRARNAQYALDHFDQAITTLLICTNIVHIAAAALVTVAVTRTWGLGAVSLSTVLTTIVLFFFGEMLPKSMAKKNSEGFTLFFAGFLRVLMNLLAPFAAVLSSIGEFWKAHTKAEAEVTVTEDELYDIIEDMAEEGQIDEKQSDIITSALSFSDVTAETILTPRVDVAALDVDMDGEAVLRFLDETNHSRLPVYEGSIDNVIGVLQVRKFMKAYLQNREIPALRSILDPVYFATEATKIDELLEQMSKQKLNMAVVVDHYGGTAGIVTVEDILEEIVGEIWDEDDVIEEPIVKLADRVYLADGDETVADVFEFMEYEDPEENEDFVNELMSEWFLENFQKLPEAGDSFTYHALRVTVDTMEHNRILKLKVEVRDAEDAPDEAPKDADGTDEPAAGSGSPADSGTADAAERGPETWNS